MYTLIEVPILLTYKETAASLTPVTCLRAREALGRMKLVCIANINFMQLHLHTLLLFMQSPTKSAQQKAHPIVTRLLAHSQNHKQYLQVNPAKSLQNTLPACLLWVRFAPNKIKIRKHCSAASCVRLADQSTVLHSTLRQTARDDRYHIARQRPHFDNAWYNGKVLYFSLESA